MVIESAHSSGITGFHVFDPLYGMLRLGEAEELLIQTKAFGRLRYIKMMGLASRDALPSATHTIYEHSLGTAHLTRQLVTRVYDQSIDYKYPSRLDLLAVCALLHDIGTSPFSHSLRFITSIGKEERDAVQDKVIAYLLTDEIQQPEYKTKGGDGGEKWKKWLNSNDSEIRRIVGTQFVETDPSYYYYIFQSPLSAHVLDFLSRDAYYTGIVSRPLNLEWIIGNLEWKKNRPNVEYQSTILALETLDWLRGQTRELGIDIRFAADKMLCRLVDRALEDGLLAKAYLTEVPEFLELNDDTLFRIIREAILKRSPPDANCELVSQTMKDFETGRDISTVKLFSVEDSKKFKEITESIRDGKDGGYRELTKFCREIEQHIDESGVVDRGFVVSAYPDMQYELYGRPDRDKLTPIEDCINEVHDEQIKRRLKKSVNWQRSEADSNESLPKEMHLYVFGKISDSKEGELRRCVSSCMN
jgi:hypothetical protein